MKLYVVDDKVQESVDYNNLHSENSLIISKITKPTLICSVNESVPEKYFKTLDCDIATTTRRAYTIGVTEGDFCINYVGDQRQELTNFLINYAQSVSGDVNNRLALRDEEGNKSLVYAPIKNGVEFAIYNGNKFYCNNEKITAALNQKRRASNINIEDLVSKLEHEYNTTALTTLPEGRKHIKNNRGIMKSCNTGQYIFDVKKKTRLVRVPAVLDEFYGIIKPQTSLMGFGELNNSRLVDNDNFYEGELTYLVQENEDDDTEEFLKVRGNAKWQLSSQ